MTVMQKILITGAAGDVGTRLRKLLKGVYPSIRTSDIRTPADLGKDEDFIAADLADMVQVQKMVAGVQGIIHLGGFSVEGPWDTIHKSNIVGCYNLFEAAYRAGVKRVVFASSNHAMGFYRRDQKIGVDVTVRPDSRYGVSKAFGEAIGALYADKHGLRVTCIRIGNVNDKPLDKRRLSIWIKPEDLVQLVRIARMIRTANMDSVERAFPNPVPQGTRATLDQIFKQFDVLNSVALTHGATQTGSKSEMPFEIRVTYAPRGTGKV